MVRELMVRRALRAGRALPIAAMLAGSLVLAAPAFGSRPRHHHSVSSGSPAALAADVPAAFPRHTSLATAQNWLRAAIDVRRQALTGAEQYVGALTHLSSLNETLDVSIARTAMAALTMDATGVSQITSVNGVRDALDAVVGLGALSVVVPQVRVLGRTLAALGEVQGLANGEQGAVAAIAVSHIGGSALRAERSLDADILAIVRYVSADLRLEEHVLLSVSATEASDAVAAIAKGRSVVNDAVQRLSRGEKDLRILVDRLAR